MAQITIYLDDDAMRKVKRAARGARESVSAWLSGLADRELESKWPAELREAAGSWGDCPARRGVPRRQERDAKREAP
jgi:hypothetical protein